MNGCPLESLKPLPYMPRNDYPSMLACHLVRFGRKQPQREHCVRGGGLHSLSPWYYKDFLVKNLAVSQRSGTPKWCAVQGILIGDTLYLEACRTPRIDKALASASCCSSSCNLYAFRCLGFAWRLGIVAAACLC